MNIDDKGWLRAGAGDPLVKAYPSVRTYALEVPAPLGLVWHWTGDAGEPGSAEKLAARIQRYRKEFDRPASWHVLIARDGSVLQSASFCVGTWHVGRPGVIAGRQFANINRATASCELENAGRLRRIADRCYSWPYWINPAAPPNERRPNPRLLVPNARAAVVLGDGAFDAFTAEQELAAAAVVGALRDRFGWGREAFGYGHVDFDSPRKDDPGPLWRKIVLPRLLDNVFGAVGLEAPQSGAGG